MMYDKGSIYSIITATTYMLDYITNAGGYSLNRKFNTTEHL
jgi:hypothetical protein